MSSKFDRGIDLFESVTHFHDQRTGASSHRVARSLANNVHPEVVALQATLNSKKNNPDNPLTFTSEHIVGVAMWHEANRTRSAYTKEQAGEIDRNQKDADEEANLLDSQSI